MVVPPPLSLDRSGSALRTFRVFALSPDRLFGAQLGTGSAALVSRKSNLTEEPHRMML